MLPFRRERPVSPSESHFESWNSSLSLSSPHTRPVLFLSFASANSNRGTATSGQARTRVWTIRRLRLIRRDPVAVRLRQRRIYPTTNSIRRNETALSFPIINAARLPMLFIRGRPTRISAPSIQPRVSRRVSSTLPERGGNAIPSGARSRFQLSRNRINPLRKSPRRRE
jgi:hypothetical protein